MGAWELVVSLSGGAPWGFRLQGGAEHQKPLQVAKVRRRSKACRAGLKEQDELVSIGDHPCSELSHTEAMSLQIPFSCGQPLISTFRAPPGFYAFTSRLLSPTSDILQKSDPSLLPAGVTSPPDSEAYYGETDSDADTQSLTHRPRLPAPAPGGGGRRGDSGFQDAGGTAGCGTPVCPPLVSPERAREALTLGSGTQLVPMVGPQERAVNDELSTTYKDKARQAKLQRKESQVEKQVKEARTKCRSIASLLTDAPNPNSKGVLMFKKRRQRAKKYTLTCFGKAPEDKGSETEGETEEEGGSSILSGSELDEEGFSASYDPTWDSGYLDLLDRRIGSYPRSGHAGLSRYEAGERNRDSTNRLFANLYTDVSASYADANGGAVEVSRASMVLNPPSQNPVPSHSTQPVNPSQVNDLNSMLSPSVLNRTARPFNSATSTPSRPTVTSVMFRPPQPKPLCAPSPPVSAVSMMTLSSPRQPDSKRAVSSTSLYIPARNTNGNSSDMSSIHSPPSSLSSATTISVSAPPPPPTTPVNAYFNMQAPTPQVPSNDSLASREQRIAVPAARTGILHDARKRSQKKPMFSALQSKDVNPNPDLVSMVQNMDDRFVKSPNVETSGVAPVIEAGHESGPEEDWLRLGAEACNFMQAQRQPKPPPVAPKPKSPVLPQMQEKPQAPQMPVLGGKGGQLFAKRQNRMDRYVVERSPSVVAMPYSPAQTREPSPTPSLPATWKYSSSIRAPPPINYNPLLSPSCPLKAQKKQEPPKSRTAKSKKQVGKAVDVMKHQPYQLSSSLFSYGGNTNQDIPNRQPQRGTPGNVHKTAKVYEVKRFSTPPPMTTGPALKVIVPRSATTLGEPMWRSDIASPPPQANSVPYQVKSVPDLSPLSPQGASSQFNSQFRGPRPRFSTSNLGLQPCVWRPGSTLY
uniref:Synaptopodin 2-like b n=1 Tax=Neogobius melanostomus TaxID=47308 RepID=A0A8C6V710_9GOBI